MDMREVIFFEKQDGRLCAQHALNMLLQEPYFSAEALAEIAHELDDKEKQLLSSEDRERFRSQNFDDTGYFSLQVRLFMQSVIYLQFLGHYCCIEKSAGFALDSD
jgi:ataxin-3